jgi:hypothetical protein
MFNLRYKEEYNKCTGNNAECCGWDPEDLPEISEDYVTWLESLVDETKLKEKLLEVEKKKQELKPTKTVTSVIADI